MDKRKEVKEIMKKFYATILSILMLILSINVVHGSQNNSKKLIGGGHIQNGIFDISFGGNIRDNGSYTGQFQVNFHGVSEETIQGGHFHSTSIKSVNWFPGGATCDSAMNTSMSGKFNGEDGWELVFRAGDNEDSVRFELFNSNGDPIYDSYASDFKGESTCVGSARAFLDNGNLSIKI